MSFDPALSMMEQVQPDEIYNLGAMSHVKVSFEMSEYTAECDGVGVLRLLNAIRSAGLETKTRLYQVTHRRANNRETNFRVVIFMVLTRL